MGSNGWKRVKLENSVVEIIDGDRGVNYPKQDEFFEHDYCLFLNAGNVTVDGFNFEKTQFIKKEKDALLRKGKLKRNDIVLTTRGTVGNVAYYDDSIPFDNMRINSGMVILRLGNGQQEIYTRYLYHFLKSSFFSESILSHSSGSAQPQLPIRDLKQIELLLPPFDTQRRIADILSALDEKIELNRQTNATLEAIAQSIFREWFVDGEDIDDWEVGKLGDIAENIRRSVQPSEIEPDTPYIGLEHMPRKSIALSEWDTASDVMSNKYLFKQDEFLFGKLRPYFHKVGVAPLDGVSSTDILVVAPKEDDYYGVVLGHISSVDLINHTTAASTGTKMPRTNWSDIARYEIALPPKEKAKQFSGFMKSVVQLIQSNIMEARTLANIRDTLLPKLMSGEIDV